MKTLKTNLDLLSLKKTKTDIPRVQISNAEDAANYIRNFYFDDIEIYESFFLLLLNRNKNTIGYAKISQGGVAGTVVDIKLIAKYITDSCASGIIIAHNHPSGNKKPSMDDLKVTQKVKNIMQFFDCVLFDHIILTENSYYSFANDGTL